MFKQIVSIVAVDALGVGLYYGMAFSTPSVGQTNISTVVGTFDKLDVKNPVRPVSPSKPKRMSTL